MLQEEIVRLLQADPARGLQEAIDQYAALVRRIILAKIGAARHADAEELTSDVFYTLFCSRTQIYLQKGSFGCAVLCRQRRFFGCFADDDYGTGSAAYRQKR